MGMSSIVYMGHSMKMSGVLVVGIVMGMSTVAQMPLPFPCLLLPSMNI